MKENPDNVFWDRISERAEETKKAFAEGRLPKVVRYAVHVTSACNMRCKYCRDRKNSPQTMDKGIFQHICWEAGKTGMVHITGGEPSLVPWLPAEILAFKDRTKFAWNSNLLILPPDETLRALFRVKTSLDDYHADRWNELVGGDYFDTVVKNIKHACTLTEHVSVSFTATHKNATKFDNFIRFCQDEFPDLFSISASFYKGENKELALTQNDLDSLFESAEELDEVSKSIFQATHKRDGNVFPENNTIPCYLSLTERLYDEYGMEYYCSHLYRDHVQAPGRPGLDPHCVTGCNARFYKFNKEIHEALEKRKC